MMGTNYMEEIDCGSFFDHIDDLLDFPGDDLDTSLPGGRCGGGFPPVWMNESPEGLGGTDSVFSDPNSNSASDLSAELSVPYEDIVHLEWLSNFVEDSFSGGGLTIDKNTSSSSKESSSNHQFQTSSPVSVLESSSTCSNPNTVPVTHEKRARTKRPRPPKFNPRPHQLITPENPHEPLISLNVSSESDNAAESKILSIPKKPVLVSGEQKKKKKIKILPPSGSGESVQNQNLNSCPPGQGVRKCMHCEITKTPQWRSGPLGPKTLCNACGVRYKSGRLFPEYRPAASPTFIPSLHSNSHKKVLEMRGKTTDDEPPMPEPAPSYAQPELIPRSELLPAYI